MTYYPQAVTVIENIAGPYEQRAAAWPCAEPLALERRAQFGHEQTAF